MQQSTVTIAAVLLVLTALARTTSAHVTNDATVEALRSELTALSLEYQSRIADLEARLANLEAGDRQDELSRLQQAAQQAAGSQGSKEVEVPVEPSVGRERNLNRLNPEISITGIVLGNATDQGRNEIQAQEFELDLQSALDPFSRTRVTLAFRQEEVEIEEGYVIYNSLPGSMELMAGKFRQRFGKLNRQHRHALPQSDYPLANQVYFGEDGLAQTGLSLNWLLPRLWSSASDLTLEITNGENEVAFGGELFEDLSVLGRVNNYWDLNAASYLEWGLSGVVGKTADQGDSRVWGTDFTYLWQPPSRAKYRGITWRTGLLLSQRDDELGERQDAWGGYTYLEGLVRQNLYLGVRADRAEDPLEPDTYQWGVTPYLTWWQSEYVRLRLEYGYLRDNALEEAENRFTLQLTWAAGPHKHSTY